MGCLIPPHMLRSVCTGPVRNREREDSGVRRTAFLSEHRTPNQVNIRCDVARIQAGRIFRALTSGAPGRPNLLPWGSDLLQVRSMIIIRAPSGVRRIPYLPGVRQQFFINNYIARRYLIGDPQGRPRAFLFLCKFHRLAIRRRGEDAFVRQSIRPLLLLPSLLILEESGELARGAGTRLSASGRLVPWSQLRSHGPAVAARVSELETSNSHPGAVRLPGTGRSAVHHAPSGTDQGRTVFSLSPNSTGKRGGLRHANRLPLIRGTSFSFSSTPDI